MSNTPAPRSHPSWWWFGALFLLLPLLYVLSVPAVLRCMSMNAHPQDLKYSRKTPQWIQTFSTPYNQILDSDTPLKNPLEAYTELWGYKRHPTTVRHEQTMRRVAEARARIEKIRKDMEERLGRPLPKPRLYLPPAPPPYLDALPAAKPPVHESLLRKSS